MMYKYYSENNISWLQSPADLTGALAMDKLE